MPKVAYTVDARKAKEKLLFLQTKIRTAGVVSLREIGELGKNYARSKAPYRTGKTFRNIILRTVAGNEIIIEAHNPTADRTDGFNLVRWMHTSAKARKHIHSGDPQFMYRTSSYLRKVAPALVQGRFNKIVAQVNSK
jgi:hypothetical protein